MEAVVIRLSNKLVPRVKKKIKKKSLQIEFKWFNGDTH